MIEHNLPNNSLLKKTKEKIEKNIFKDILKAFQITEKCFLVVDNRGAQFISNYFTLSEVINQGIISIESLYLKRKPYKLYSAIYIISGDNNSIQNVINDFKSEEKRLYKSCHLFILDEIDNNLLDLIVNNNQFRNFFKHIKTLKQILIKYTAIDKNLFTFGNEENFNSISNLYGKNEEMNNVSIARLVSVCINLNNYPNIVYFNPDNNCKTVAEKVNKELKKYFSSKKGTKKNGFLLITSRFLDFVAPLQFNLIYQNLLLENHKKKDINNYNKIIKSNKKESILDYKDSLFTKYKSMFIYEVIKDCPEEFSEFKKSEVGQTYKIKDENNSDINNLIAAAKNVPKYQYYIDLFSKHIDLSKEINDILKRRNIMDILDMQKTIISNLNDEGKKCSEKEIISMIKNIKKIENDDIMRLLCLIRYYYPEIEMNELFNVLESKNILLSEIEKKIINYLSQGKCLINVDTMKELNKSIISYREKNDYETEEEKDNKDDKRFPYVKECKLTTICDMCCKNQLPKNIFTFVEKPENIKTQKNFAINFGNIIDDSEDGNDLQNLILFNIGGLSNYEISSLERGNYIKQYNMNLILGGNIIYNYKEYLDEIKDYFKGNVQIRRPKEVIPKEILKTIEQNKKKENNEKRKENAEQKVNIREDDDKNYYDGKGSKENLKKFKKKKSDDDSFETDLK